MWFAMMMQSEMLQLNAIGYKNAANFEEDAFWRRNSRMLARAAGWVRYSVPGEDGKMQDCLIYTAPYHRYDEADGKWRLLKWLYAALVLLAAVCTIASLCLPGILTGVGLADVPSALALLPLGYLLYTAVFQLASPRNLTTYQYRMGVRRFKAGLIAAASLTVLACAAVVGYVLGRHPALQSTDVTRVALVAAAAVASVSLSVLELTRKCPEVPNDDPLPAGAIQV